MTKASDNVFPRLLISEGGSTSTPAAGRVTVYAKADGLLYSKDDAGTETLVSGGAGGGSVATDAIWDAAGDLAVGTGANTAAKLAIGANGYVLTSNGTTATWAAASGGGVSWTQDIDEDGTSFANWTANGGTWASDGTTINQTDTGGAVRYAEYATVFPLGWPFILEFEAQVITASGRAGIGVFDTSQSGGAMALYIQQGTGVVLEQTGSAVIRTISTTISASTWYKIRAVVGTVWMSVYKDGTFIGNISVIRTWDDNMEYVALYSYAASVKFRNIKAWTLTGGAPA